MEWKGSAYNTTHTLQADTCSSEEVVSSWSFPGFLCDQFVSLSNHFIRLSKEKYLLLTLQTRTHGSKGPWTCSGPWACAWNACSIIHPYLCIYIGLSTLHWLCSKPQWERSSDVLWTASLLRVPPAGFNSDSSSHFMSSSNVPRVKSSAYLQVTGRTRHLDKAGALYGALWNALRSNEAQEKNNMSCNL